MMASKSFIFRFDDVEVREREFTLIKAGKVLAVEPKAFRTLLFLLHNPQRLISKEELLNTVWGDVAVTEGSLTRCIWLLRSRLGDDIHEPRYIVTVATVGYRFVCKVEVSEDDLGNHEAAGTVPAKDKSHPRWRFRGAIPWFLAVPLICLAAYVFYFRNRSQSPTYYSSEPLTNYVGSEICPSFSPDGDRVVFAWNGEKQDNFDIYVKQIGDGVLLRLTGDPKPDVSPAWSPDGRTIAFLRLNSNDKAEVLLIPSVAAAPARSLAAVTAPLTVYPRSRFIAWSQDSKWLVVSDGPSYGGVMGLFLLSIETGAKRRITLPPNEYDDVDPSFSPDMRHLAFARYAGAGGAWSDLYTLKLSADLQPEGSPERLTFYNRHVASPVWASDGRSILFTRTEVAGNPSIWRINLSGARKIEPLPLSADSSSVLDLSRRGSRLVYTREISNYNVWAVDLPPPKKSSSRTSNPRPWISSISVPENPQFSPDGQQVAFQSQSSGKDEIWVCDRDGSHARQLTHLEAVLSGFPRWSPDGKNIVFHSRPKGSARLYLVSAEGGASHRLGTGEDDAYAPSWSHDGKWIYFSSRRTGDIQVWKMPASGGPEIQITKRGGWCPLESVEGQYLYYIKLPQYALWRLPLAGGEESQILPAVATYGSAYAPGREGIYFIRPTGQGSGQDLAFLRFATSQTTSVVTIPRPAGLGLALSPDERLILYSQTDQVGSDLMVVENFH
jgi:Tol biopolymer transport system component/DNA-binding winged helix-turn-helix (wHTH) protein